MPPAPPAPSTAVDAEFIALREIAAARAAAEQRLGTVVAALENLRLDLLRLQAGTAAPESITALVDMTAGVARDVDIALEARREVEEVLT